METVDNVVLIASGIGRNTRPSKRDNKCRFLDPITISKAYRKTGSVYARPLFCPTRHDKQACCHLRNIHNISRERIHVATLRDISKGHTAEGNGCSYRERRWRVRGNHPFHRSDDCYHGIIRFLSFVNLARLSMLHEEKHTLRRKRSVPYDENPIRNSTEKQRSSPKNYRKTSVQFRPPPSLYSLPAPYRQNHSKNRPHKQYFR